MQAIKTIQRWALLGTDKARIDWSVLPEPLIEALPDTNDPEQKLFRAAALALAFQSGGAIPDKSGLPALPEAPPEQLPACPDAAARILPALLQAPVLRVELLAVFLEKILEQGWRIQPGMILPILEIALHQPGGKMLQPLLARAAGERGAWLAQFEAEWAFLKPQDPNEQFGLASNAERRRILQQIRRQNPSLAFLRAQEAIQTETNSREILALLHILHQKPEAEELDFWSAIYNRYGEMQDKPVYREIRKMAVDVLLRLPNSGMFQSLVPLFQDLFSRKKIGPGHVEKLPWLSREALPATLLLEESNPYGRLNDSVFWLSEIVRCAHPCLWEQCIGPDWSQILERFAQIEQPFVHKISLSGSLAYALAKTAYLPGIRAYLAQYAVDDANFNMLSALPPSEIEAYVLRQSQAPFHGYWLEILQRPSWIWTPALSRFILERISSGPPEGYHYQEFSKLLRIGLHVHADLIPDIYRLSMQEPRDWQQQIIRNQFLRPLLYLVETRHAIDQL